MKMNIKKGDEKNLEELKKRIVEEKPDEFFSDDSMHFIKSESAEFFDPFDKTNPCGKAIVGDPDDSF